MSERCNQRKGGRGAVSNRGAKREEERRSEREREREREGARGEREG